MSIIDVAKAAGVSTATVSRVMNELPGVRDETIALVRAAIAELNYKPRRPSAAAGPRGNGSEVAPERPRRRSRAPGPKSGQPSFSSEVGLRTGNLAVVTVGHGPSWLQVPVMAAALTGIQRGVGELGLRLMLEEMRDPSRPTDLIRTRGVDGVIVFLSSELPSAAIAQAFSTIRSYVPCVRAMGTSLMPGLVDHVTIDNVGVGHLAAAHLLARGCRHLAFLADMPGWPLVRLRGQAFLDRVRDEQADEATAYLVGADARAAAAYGADAVVEADLDALVARLAHAAKRRGAAPLGLFIYNDNATSQVHPLLARHGLRLGEHVELVSCDAEQARLDAMHPRPASIDPGAEEIGFRAVVRLLARIQRPNDPLITIHVAPRL